MAPHGQAKAYPSKVSLETPQDEGAYDLLPNATGQNADHKKGRKISGPLEHGQDGVHFDVVECREPVQHQGDDGRDYINSLYGMTDRPFEDLVSLARSWSQPPRMSVDGEDFEALGYDRSERIYRLRRGSQASSAQLSINASDDSPIRNIALLVENWGSTSPRVELDGNELTRGNTFRYGHRHELTGSDLIVWIEVQSDRPVTLTLSDARQ